MSVRHHTDGEPLGKFSRSLVAIKVLANHGAETEDYIREKKVIAVLLKTIAEVVFSMPPV